MLSHKAEKYSVIVLCLCDCTPQRSVIVFVCVCVYILSWLQQELLHPVAFDVQNCL